MSHKNLNPIKKAQSFVLSLVMFAVISVPVSAAPIYYSNDFPMLKTVKAYLKHDYVEKNLKDKELEYGAIKGMLESLDDPYTRFMEPKNYKEMQIRMSGEFYEIGRAHV